MVSFGRNNNKRLGGEETKGVYINSDVDGLSVIHIHSHTHLQEDNQALKISFVPSVSTYCYMHAHASKCTYTQVCRKNWMFRLVGVETFKIGKKTAEITINSKGIAFEYALSIGGKTLKKFIEAQAKNTRTWLLDMSGEQHRVVLGR